MDRNSNSDYRRSLLKSLFDRDVETWSYITGGLLKWHFDFCSELASSLIKQGYKSESALSLVSLSAWYYATLVNSRHYDYAGISQEYLDLLKSRIKGECEQLEVSFSVIIEIASVLHWKSMSIHASKAEYAGEFETSGNGTINMWLYYLPSQWGLDKVDSNQGMSQFSPKTLKDFSSYSTNYDRVEHLRNNLLWNLLNFYCLPAVIKNENTSSLIFESLECLMCKEFETDVYSVAIPLYAVRMFIDDGQTDLLTFNEYIKEGLVDNGLIVMDNAPIGTFVGQSFPDYYAAWCRWQKWTNPSKDIHNLIYAVTFKMMQGKDAAAQYFYNKLKDNVKPTAYLDELSRFKDICSKISVTTLHYYIEQRQYHIISVKPDINQIVEYDNEPRSISMIVADLDIPSELSPEHQDTKHEDQTFDGNDSVNPREKRHVTVLNSKLKGSNSEEKDRELPRCLSLLYDELTKEGLIDTTSSKSLFVYRFSGKGESYPLTTKINWRGKNVLLGHIIRCLLSDARNAPEDLGIAAEFFESKTGKPINLATAKQVPVNDYEKERNNLDPNFVEAVEFLRRCGFINAEYTSKRR